MQSGRNLKQIILVKLDGHLHPCGYNLTDLSYDEADAIY